MIRKKKETRTVITNALTFFSIMKGRWVLLQAQVTVFYMKVFLISRAIFPLRPHFITGEYRVIIIIIIIKPFSLLPPKAECSLFFFCGHKPSFFFWGGGNGGFNQRYSAVSSTSFIYWKKPRIFLVCGIVDAFSHWYLHRIIKLDSISQWIQANHIVRFSYQITDNFQASDCFTKNNEKFLTYLCSG